MSTKSTVHGRVGDIPAGSRARERRMKPKPVARTCDEHARAALALPPFVRAVRGRIGDVVHKTYGRRIVVTRVPRMAGIVASEAQRTHRERMRAATAYARRVYADPAAKAIYVAAAKRLGRQRFG